MKKKEKRERQGSVLKGGRGMGEEETNASDLERGSGGESGEGVRLYTG
jgi:hypothetical protein